MIEIGGKPILWHLMKIYSAQGFNDFVICAGYKQHVIKEWFANYYLHTSDVTFDFANNNEVIIHNRHAEPWKVTIIDTGLSTQTGGRLKRVKEFVGNERFLFNYGDAVGNVNIKDVIAFHEQKKTIGTITVHNFGNNKGVLDIENDGTVKSFREKSDLDGNLINIGFMVFEPQIFDYIDNDNTVFEQEPLAALIAKNQLSAYVHKGFWQCMDTLREKQLLEKLWNEGNAPWKIW